MMTTATTNIMGSHIFITTTCLCSSSTATKPVVQSLSSSQQHYKVPKFGVYKNKSHPGFGVFSQWSGLKHLGVLVKPRLLSKEKKRKCRGVKVSASLFGVGAPEALVIGVVALLVFGPKGLAEVARNLGKTLRAFQPTIRELQDVSREFKSTLEKEIGLDDISNTTQRMYTSEKFNGAQSPSSTVSAENPQTAVDPNGVTSPNSAYSSEEYLKFTEEQLKSSATKQEQNPDVEESEFEPQNQRQVTVKDNADTAYPPLEKPESKA